MEEERKEGGWPLPVFPVLAGAVLIILLGVVSGYLLSSRKLFPTSSKKASQETKEAIKKGTVFGSDDLKTFRDTAEGVLERGGVNGEGSHHLTRPGGESQKAYLTSSIVDLDQFVGRKVKIWGETNRAQKAGWLMDVGRVEVLD